MINTPMDDCDKMFSAKARNMSALAALAVVVIHAGEGGMGSFVAKMMHQFFGWGLCTFAVPWFFFASGYFFARHLDEKGWWARAVWTRLRTLLVPYVIWCALFVCFSLCPGVAQNLRTGQPLFTDIPIRHLLVCGFGFDVSSHPLLVPFWFIRALMVIVLLSPLLVCALRRWLWIVPAGMLPAYVYCCALNYRYAMPWFLFYSIFSLAGWLYFSVGILARRDRWEARSCRIPTGLCWGVALPAICVGRFALYKGFAAVANCLWLGIVPLLILGVWRLVPARLWPTWLIASAFPVYAVHYFLERGLEFSILPLSHPAWWAYVMRAVIVALSSLAVANVLRIFFPRLAGVLWGGRQSIGSKTVST